MGSEFQQLVQRLSKLPGLGPRSGLRTALHLLKNKEKVLLPLLQSLERVRDTVGFCFRCGLLDETDPCAICLDPNRDGSILCVVADVADAWAFERARSYQGRYHVLGGVLSALDGMNPENLRMTTLLNRCKGEVSRNGEIKEVILALNTTVEGQATAHYIADMLSGLPSLKITALACGIPVGGMLDYLDEGTLVTALARRETITP